MNLHWLEENKLCVSVGKIERHFALNVGATLLRLSVGVDDDVAQSLGAGKRLKTQLHTTGAILRHLGYHSRLHHHHHHHHHQAQVKCYNIT